MTLLKRKNFNRKLLEKAILAMILQAALNGCSLSGKKEVTLKGDYCDKYYPLPQNNEVKSDIAKISKSLYEYIKINETTQICNCLYPKEKQQCYQEFLELD